MRDWTISAAGLDPAPARQIARQACPQLTRRAPRRRTYLLTGTAQPLPAACAQTALAAGHRIVLLPGTPDRTTCTAPDGTLLQVSDQAITAAPAVARTASTSAKATG